jgi:hypothetical protein
VRAACLLVVNGIVEVQEIGIVEVVHKSHIDVAGSDVHVGHGVEAFVPVVIAN